MCVLDIVPSIILKPEKEIIIIEQKSLYIYHHIGQSKVISWILDKV
jgi:hypothetical protein